MTRSELNAKLQELVGDDDVNIFLYFDGELEGNFKVFLDDDGDISIQL